MAAGTYQKEKTKASQIWKEVSLCDRFTTVEKGKADGKEEYRLRREVHRICEKGKVRSNMGLI